MNKSLSKAIALLLGWLLALMFLGNPAHAEKTLVKSPNKEKEKIDNKNATPEVSLENLLGPEDNFPFLPDNHRDSGTGKFANF